MNIQPTIVILTALPLEYEAVVAYLPQRRKEIKSDNTIYEIGEYVTPKAPWQVVVGKLAAQGNYQAARETEWAIGHFAPTYMFFVGIAGGLKDVQLGDVVAASFVRGYEGGKTEDDKWKSRAQVEHSSYALLQLAHNLAGESQWLKKLFTPAQPAPKAWEWLKKLFTPAQPAPKARVGPIASGEKVVASRAFLAQLQETCSDAVAVEMEALGFLGTFRAKPQVQGIVIRGISDLVVDKSKTDAKGWQPIAARNAATFAFAMLDELAPVTTTSTVPSPVEDMPKISNLPLQQNLFFTGRDDVLEKLHRALKQENSVALYSVALNGIGGVGKTQTALEYAYRYQSEYQAILWVSGDGEDILRLNFANLTGVLGLPKLDKQEDAIAAVRNWLNTHNHWLLIIDNAETAKELKAAYDLIPPTTRGRRLFTTRTQAIGHFAEPLEIDCLEDMTGGVLLVRRARLVDWRLSTQEVSTALKKRDWQTAQEISRELGGLPLALDQAGAYIEQNTLGLQDYLSRYHDYAPQMLKFESQGQYPCSVYVAFQMALEKVEKRTPLAGEVLRLCAFLHPDGIQVKLFNTLSDNPLLLDEAMAALNDYSLVKRIPERKLLTVHRVVQQVVKEVCDE